MIDIQFEPIYSIVTFADHSLGTLVDKNRKFEQPFDRFNSKICTNKYNCGALPYRLRVLYIMKKQSGCANEGEAIKIGACGCRMVALALVVICKPMYPSER